MALNRTLPLHIRAKIILNVGIALLHVIVVRFNRINSLLILRIHVSSINLSNYTISSSAS
nr:MAG TPA_asm: hypothetical protein [Bacteriophage sp.]